MPKERVSPLRKMLYIVSAIGGWALFIIEWVRVSHQTAHSDEIILVVVLILSLLLIHIGTYSWIGHNKRIAARGKRGSSTRYASPQFSRDYLGRALIVDRNVHESREILISIDGETKAYHSVNVPEEVLR
jgi:hypothetical protein